MAQEIKWNSHYIVKKAPIELNEGDKVILPSSALEQLLSKTEQLPSPLIFQLKHPHSGKSLHCGIKEFSSDVSNKIELPAWIMDYLELNEQDRVLIQLDMLPKGTFTRLKPVSFDYKDIQDYRAALEAHLRKNYHTLTKNQILSCRYGDQIYQFQVLDLKPQDAVSITDTDLEVDIDSLVQTSLNPTTNLEIQLDQKVTQVEIDQHQYRYYKLKLPKNQQSIAIQCEIQQGDVDIVVSSVDKKPTLDNHEWSDLSSSKTKQLIIHSHDEYHIGFHGYHQQNTIESIRVIATTTTTTNDTPSDQHDDAMLVDEDRTGKIQCSNCQQWVLERTMMLHEGFCRRNNVCCKDCGKIFKKDSQEYKEHWHCEECDYIGDVNDREKHVNYVHTIKTCVCQQFSTHSFNELANHRRTECPEKLIFCRYCHILTAQGVKSLNGKDRLLGLHSHESYCGSRTIVCQKCNKPVPIKDIQVHGKIHEIKRQQQTLPPLCSNRNCTRAQVKNKLSFCQFCFGPFWITEDDPKNQKLIQRIARKIHQQLTIGCGNEWCQNKYCASFTKDPKDATTAASLLIPMIKNVSKELTKSRPNPELYLCVDESTSKKQLLANVLHEQVQDEYELGWCIRALESCNQDLDEANTWLNRNAPRLNHQL